MSNGIVRGFKDLKVWQKSITLVPTVYSVVKKLPSEERFALGDQIRRAAVSVPANIAEGQARQHTKEFIQFLSISRGSLAELETLLIISERLGYCCRKDLCRLSEAVSEVRRLLQGLINTLRKKIPRKRTKASDH
jgi:four helix bundle protein